MPDSDLLDTPEVAVYLRVPMATLSQWRYLRRGPRWVKVGRHVRYRRTDLNKWLDEQSHGGDAA